MSLFKKVICLLLVAALSANLCACAPKQAKCEVISAEYVDNIPIGSVFYSFEGEDILKIIFNVTATEKFAIAGIEGDEPRQKVYKYIIEGCTLTNGGKEVELKYGYWPKEATDYKAQEMSLFYCVPEGTNLKDLTFKMDGKVLGDAQYQFSYTPGE